MTNRVAYERQSQFRAKHASSNGNPTTANAALDAATGELEHVDIELEASTSAETKFEALLESQTYSLLGLIKHLAKEMTIVNRLRCLENPPAVIYSLLPLKVEEVTFLFPGAVEDITVGARKLHIIEPM
jgi:hypothetical protein